MQIPKNHPQLGRWVARQRSLYRTIDHTDAKAAVASTSIERTGCRIKFSSNRDEEGQIYRDGTKKRKRYGDFTKQGSKSPLSLTTESPSSTLTKERIQALNEIGFEWTSTVKGTAFNNAWEKRYNDLCSYRDQHGHCNVPKNYPCDKALGTWVRNQRAQYWSMKKGERSPMTSERVNLLEAVGFKWKLR